MKRPITQKQYGVANMKCTAKKSDQVEPYNVIWQIYASMMLAKVLRTEPSITTHQKNMQLATGKTRIVSTIQPDAQRSRSTWKSIGKLHAITSNLLSSIIQHQLFSCPQHHFKLFGFNNRKPKETSRLI